MRYNLHTIFRAILQKINKNKNVKQQQIITSAKFIQTIE